MPFAAAEAQIVRLFLSELELSLLTERMQALGQDNNSFARHLLDIYRSNNERGLDQQWSRDDIKGAAGAIFIAGTDTVSLPHLVSSGNPGVALTR